MARLPSQRDKPDTAREYETIYILRPNTPNEGVAEVNTRIRGVIEGMGGKIIKVDNWGKRRLAYEVAKERKGIYLYWLYLAQPGVVEETERNLRMLDPVIRYLTVKVDENVNITARPTELDDGSFEKAAQTAADEEDMFLSRGSEESAAEDDDEFGGDDYEMPGMEQNVPAVVVPPPTTGEKE
jgi:small subunit ribosomal protein S6